MVTFRSKLSPNAVLLLPPNPICHSDGRETHFDVRRRSTAAERFGEFMVGWFPGWEITIAWFAAIAIAAAIHFGPVARLVELGS